MTGCLEIMMRLERLRVACLGVGITAISKDSVVAVRVLRLHFFRGMASPELSSSVP